MFLTNQEISTLSYSLAFGQQVRVAKRLGLSFSGFHLGRKTEEKINDLSNTLRRKGSQKAKVPF